MPKHISTKPSKPAKPFDDFPLFAHQTRRWAKKVKGRMVYFGSWDDPMGALDRWNAAKDFLLAGGDPKTMPESQPTTDGGLTVRQLVNRYLTAKTRKMEAGDLQPWTFNFMHRTGALVVDAFGDRLVSALTPADFGRFRVELAKGRGPVSLSNLIQGVRSIFKHGFDSGDFDVPVRFGPEFVKPSKRTMRLAKKSASDKTFTAAEIRAMLAIASVPMKAMILLGINCGMGNADVACLPKSAVDLDAAMIRFPRPKTGIDRQAPLWKETVKALSDAIDNRPKAKDRAHDGLVFLTTFGKPWVRTSKPTRRKCKCGQTYNETAESPACPDCGAVPPKRKTHASMTDSVRLEFSKLMAAARVPNSRGFYCLRHSFRTEAGDAGDKDAINRIMGHEPGGDVGEQFYNHRFDPKRLRKVTNHVRGWLFGK